MKRPPIKEMPGNLNLNIAEKIILLYLGLYLARYLVFRRIDRAFYRRKISASSRMSWKRLFEDEFGSCTRLPVDTYRDCAFLEYRVRSLIQTVDSVQFDDKKPWHGPRFSIGNSLFPVG